eukprot:PITA_09019
MVDCKYVTTLMELNFKKLCGSAAGPDLGNPFECHQLVGSLVFLVNSRPDICFALNTLSQFMVKPHHKNWIAAKNLLRYLQDTITYGLRYTAENVRFHGYFDAHWAGSRNWLLLSIVEAEYIVVGMASCEAVWLRKLFYELFGHVLDTTVILCDNQSGIRLSENLVFHDSSKHIDIRAIRFHHIGTDDQVVDILMKPLGMVKFLTFREQLGVVERPSYVGPV